MENLDEIIADAEDVRDVVNLHRHPKVYHTHVNPFEIYSNEQFKKRYRMSKETARYVLNLIRDQLTPLHGNRGRPVSPEIQLMSCIRYLSKGAYEEDMGKLQIHYPLKSII